MVDLRRTFWIFDWDGTLIDLAPTPDSIQVPPETIDHLEILRRHCAGRVAIVSGRALKDLESRIPLPQLSLVGNHGAQWRVNGQYGVKKLGQAEADELKEATAILSRLSQKYPGSELENKEWTLSFHVRNVDPKKHQSVREAVYHGIRQFLHLQIRPAKSCWEIRPLSAPSKGDAVKHLAGDALTPVIFGDDATDEDMFLTAPAHAITVIVGPRRPTQARFSLSSPKALRDILRELAGHASQLGE